MATKAGKDSFHKVNISIFHICVCLVPGTENFQNLWLWSLWSTHSTFFYSCTLFCVLCIVKHVCIGCVYGEQKTTFDTWFSSSILWIWGIKFRPWTLMQMPLSAGLSCQAHLPLYYLVIVIWLCWPGQLLWWAVTCGFLWCWGVALLDSTPCLMICCLLDVDSNGVMV